MIEERETIISQLRAEKEELESALENKRNYERIVGGLTSFLSRGEVMRVEKILNSRGDENLDAIIEEVKKFKLDLGEYLRDNLSLAQMRYIPASDEGFDSRKRAVQSSSGETMSATKSYWFFSLATTLDRLEETIRELEKEIR